MTFGEGKKNLGGEEKKKTQQRCKVSKNVKSRFRLLAFKINVIIEAVVCFIWL